MNKKRLLFLGLMLTLPVNALAKDFETKAGYTIPEADYQNLSKVHTDEYLYTMPYGRYEQLKSYNFDFSKAQTTTKYIYTACDLVTSECASKEISEQEYENSVYLPSPYLSTSIETTYKKLYLSLTVGNNGTAHFILDNVWKKMPSVRSFDVMGVRLGNFSVVRGSEYGTQIYGSNGNNDTVNYAANGTNINVQDNGFGISMNLINDTSITLLQNSISAILSLDAKPAVIYGSYQHATEDVTLAQSKSYTIGSGGLGAVFKFSGSIGDKYDAMIGVYDNVKSY